MILKQVIRYPNAPALEATWVDADGIVLRCHAYDATQMDELRADLGADAPQYEPMIQQCLNDYTPEPYDIEAAKAEKNEQINKWRLAANQGTFDHMGFTFSCDQLSRSDIDGITSFVSLYGSLPPGWPGAWKASDNSMYPITSIDEWREFVGSMVAQGNTNFAKSQMLKSELEQATSKEMVDAIDWW